MGKMVTHEKKIEWKHLGEIERSEIIDLMNLPLVRRQMPLLKGEFTKTDCDAFIQAKETMWQEAGFGPWAFVVDGQFAGWGGVQPDDGEADLALVLHPNFWGLGKQLYRLIVAKAFNELKVESIQVLFPPSRERVQGLLRLGFVQENEVTIGDEQFIRYRLDLRTFQAQVNN